MKNINQYISEKLRISRNSQIKEIKVIDSLEDLKKEIKNRMITNSKTHLDLSDITLTENVTSLEMLFYNKSDIKSIDVSDWDTSNVQKMNEMFYGCNELEEVIGLDTWNTANCQSFRKMFTDCYKLNTISIEKWNIQSLRDATYMFKNCENLYLDLRDWNLSNVKDTLFNKNSKVIIQ